VPMTLAASHLNRKKKHLCMIHEKPSKHMGIRVFLSQIATNTLWVTSRKRGPKRHDQFSRNGEPLKNEVRMSTILYATLAESSRVRNHPLTSESPKLGIMTALRTSQILVIRVLSARRTTTDAVHPVAGPLDALRDETTFSTNSKKSISLATRPPSSSNMDDTYSHTLVLLGTFRFD
jgi:hypothetical protein